MISLYASKEQRGLTQEPECCVMLSVRRHSNELRMRCNDLGGHSDHISQAQIYECRSSVLRLSSFTQECCVNTGACSQRTGMSPAGEYEAVPDRSGCPRHASNRLGNNSVLERADQYGASAVLREQVDLMLLFSIMEQFIALNQTPGNSQASTKNLGRFNTS